MRIEKSSEISTDWKSLRLSSNQKKTHLNQRKKKFRGKQGPSLKYFSLFLGTDQLINNKEASISNFPELESKLSTQHIRTRITEVFEDVLTHKQKFKKILTRISNLSGLYEYQISRLTRSDWWIMLLLQTVLGIVITILISGLLLSPNTLTDIQVPLKWSSTFISQPWFLLIAFFFKCVLIFLIQYREHKMHLISKQALRTMIFDKLLVTDLYFLENSNNNLIYRLFYEKFSLFTRYHKNWSYLIPPSMVLLTIIAYSIEKRDTEGIILTLMVSFRILLAYYVEKGKALYKFDYSLKSFEQRKVVYEFVSHFKSFTLTNLQKRYSHLVKNLQTEKHQSLSSLLLYSDIQNIPSKICVVLTLLYGPLSTELSSDRESQTPYFDQTKQMNYNIRAYFMTIYVYLVMEISISGLNKFINGFLEHKESIYFFDRFFDNDFVIDSIVKTEKDMHEGSVVLEDCEILERDKDNINEVLNYILIKNQNNKSGINRKDSQHSCDPLRKKSVKRSKKGSSENETSPVMSKFQVICTELSVSIKPRDKVCLFETKDNKKVISGFLGMLLGENHINKGTVKMNGSVSYFNPKKMQILVGKTIRDNILFGQEFLPERYSDVLKVFGVKFGNYPGLDFYQIAEGAVNIRTEDIKIILFSRFLYQISDIYIIEGYFGDLNMSIMMPQIKNILTNVLQSKTVIFCSNNIDLIKLSNTVITFEQNMRNHVASVNAFLTQVEKLRQPQSLTVNSTYSVFEKQKSNRRVEVLSGKLKNSIFISSISYEEELEIHKKLVSQEKEIEKMKAKNPQILELLTYGIFLAYRKRLEGQFLEEWKPISVEQMKTLMNEHGITKKVKKMLAQASVIFILPFTLYYYTEYLVFELSVEKYDYETYFSRLILFKTPNLLKIICFLVFSQLFSGLRNMIVRKYTLSLIAKLNKLIISSLIDRNIKFILNKKTHCLLDNINKYLINVELHLPILLQELFEKLGSFFVNGLIIIICTSGFGLLPVLLLPILYWLIVRKIFAGLYTVNMINSQMEQKLDDLNFQLLSIIGTFRIAGKMTKLLNHFTNLNNNLSKTQKAKYLGIRSGVHVLTIVNVNLMMVGGFGVFMMCLEGPFNLLGMRRISLFWTLLSLIRLCLVFYQIPSIILDLIDQWFSFMRIFTFLMNQEKKKMSILEDFRKKKPDFKAPIIFKNVSLTRGLQPILKKISFKLSTGSRIGFLGIEGGGRTNIFDLLTKVYERDNLENSIISIFGKKIEDLDEEKIREDVFIIEREPILFEGTIQVNLDPYLSCTEEDLIAILKCMGIQNEKSEISHLTDFDLKPINQRNILIEKRVNCYDKNLDQRCSFLSRGMSSSPKARSNYFVETSQMENLALYGSRRVLILADSMSPKISIEKSKRKDSLMRKKKKQAKNFKYEKVEKPFELANKIQKIDSIVRPNNIVRVPIKHQKDNEFKKHLSEKSQVPNVDTKEHINPLKQSDNRIGTGKMKEESIHCENSSESPKSHREQMIACKRHNVEQMDQSSIKTIKLNPRRGKSVEYSENVQKSFFKKPAISIKDKDSHEEVEYKRSQSNRKNSKRPVSPNKISSPTIPNIEIRIEELEDQSSPKPITSKKRRGKKYTSNKILEISPYQEAEDSQADQGQLKMERNSAENQEGDIMEDDDIITFLKSKVNFDGKNQSSKIRKLLMTCRAILTNPKILLLYEESLEFGEGIELNLSIISKILPDSTIICITKSILNIFSYDKIIFLDSGKVLETGNPNDLFENKGSFLHKFINEAEKDTMKYLREKLALKKKYGFNFHSYSISQQSIPIDPNKKFNIAFTLEQKQGMEEMKKLHSKLSKDFQMNKEAKWNQMNPPELITPLSRIRSDSKNSSKGKMGDGAEKYEIQENLCENDEDLHRREIKILCGPSIVRPTFNKFKPIQKQSE